MQKSWNRIAAVLAWLIGVMGMFAGGQALLGRLPGWNVVSWLPVYNFAVGVLTVFVVAPVIWRGSRFALPAAAAVLGANLAVTLALQIGFRQAVAQESMTAMLLRLTVWAVICGLLYWRRAASK